MRILLTGAGGFVGRALTSTLGAEGIEVVGTDLRASGVTTRMDVTDAREVREVFARARPDVVVHAAALVDDRLPASAHRRVNVEGTRNVLAASAGAKFVHISSIAALGVDPGPRADDDTPLVSDDDDGRDYFPAGAYFVTKAAAERHVRAARPDAVVVRPGDVYGPGSEPWVVRPLAMMRARQPVLIDGGRGLVSPCYIDDLVAGIRLAIDAPAGSLLTFHSGERVTYRAYFEALAATFGAPRPRLSLPLPLALGAARLMERAATFGLKPPMTEAAVRYLARRTQYSLASAQARGWQPQADLREGMRRLR